MRQGQSVSFDIRRNPQNTSSEAVARTGTRLLRLVKVVHMWDILAWHNGTLSIAWWFLLLLVLLVLIAAGSHAKR